MNEWNIQSTVDAYVEKTADPAISWYEDEVNFSDLLQLIPQGTASLLDFGCGPGDFTIKLAKRIPSVTGVDMAPMIDVAKKKYPQMNFIEWKEEEYQHLGKFDVIFSKLTLQFVEDLGTLAVKFSEMLHPEGIAVVSVPNPQKIAQEFGLKLNSTVFYNDTVGTTDIPIHPIHRPKEVYRDAFEEAGLTLVEASEPINPKDPEAVSKRLNLKFLKKSYPSSF